MDKLDKINKIVSRLDLYVMNDEKLIDHQSVIEIVMESALGWGEIILQEKTKENYVRFLVDSRVLERVNEGTYRFCGERWTYAREKVETALNARPLSMNQSLAVDMLASGCSDAETAAQIGMDRSTVWRWRNTSRSFIAQLAAAKQSRSEQVEVAIEAVR